MIRPFNNDNTPSTVKGAPQRSGRFLPNLRWSNRPLQFALAGGMAVGAALLSGWLTPRGPITSGEALTWMAVALAVGIAGGFMLASRWSLFVLPALFVAVVEIARLGVDGPTVDAIHLGSLYGIIAFVTGRLLHGVLVLAPMMVGSLYGVGLAAHRGHRRASIGVVGWTITGIATVALLALAIAIARPASTAPIPGPDGEPLPGSIAEIITVPLGGHEQTVMIRGRSSEKPVLLYLAGGPGGTDLGAMRLDTGLEQHFVVVTWEQRGVGKSYSALDPVETLTLEQMVADTLELVHYLRQRFDEEKIYLVGNSWGTTLGALAVQQHPELFHAYVGTGQMVSQRQTDILFYEDTLAWAEENGNHDLVATLRKNGPPPYDSLLAYEPALGHEHDWNSYPALDLSNEMPAILFVPENTLLDRINGFRSFLDTFAVLYPQLQQIDFRRDIPRLEVPVYMVIGEHEARGRAVLARQWFEMLEAPAKEMIVVDQAGHRALFDKPADFAATMARVVDETYSGRGSPAITARSIDNERDIAAFFDELIPRQLYEDHIVGATVSVVRGRELIFAQGYGYADHETQRPVSADQTLFYIGSDGKLFTWTAVMQLVEAGMLDLHADVNTYLDFAIPATFDEPITLHHLMTHTPGFEDELTAMMAASQADLLPLRTFLVEQMPQRVYAPGKVFAYSNYGTALAGYIIERVSGKPYEQYITDHLLKPLGMAHSAAIQPLPSALAAQMSKGYRYTNGDYRVADFEWAAASPAAPVRSTATDMARFLMAHLNDGCVEEACILRADSLAQMHRQQFTHHPALTGMAYGFIESEFNGRRVLWHLGESARFSTLLALLPAEKVGLLVSYNTPMPDGRGVLTQFVNAFYPVESTPPAVQSIAGWEDRATALQGSYVLARTAHTSPQKLVGWLSALSVQIVEPGVLAVGGLRYVEVEPGIFRQQNGDRVLTYRQEGDQTWIFWGPFAYFRVPWAQTPLLHLGLAALCSLIFLSAGVAWSVDGRRRRRHNQLLPLRSRIARWLAVGLGLLNTGLLGWFIVLMLGYNATYVFPAETVTLMTRLYWLSVPLTAAVLVLAFWSWLRPQSHWGWRVHDSAVAVAGIAFLWFLATWNLLAGLPI